MDKILILLLGLLAVFVAFLLFAYNQKTKLSQKKVKEHFQDDEEEDEGVEHFQDDEDEEPEHFQDDEDEEPEHFQDDEEDEGVEHFQDDEDEEPEHFQDDEEDEGVEHFQDDDEEDEGVEHFQDDDEEDEGVEHFQDDDEEEPEHFQQAGTAGANPADMKPPAAPCPPSCTKGCNPNGECLQENFECGSGSCFQQGFNQSYHQPAGAEFFQNYGVECFSNYDNGTEHFECINGIDSETGKECHQEHFDSSPMTLKLFYADWCGHCKRFKPTFDNELPKALQKANLPCKLVSVNADKSPELVKKYNVQGFPTVILENAKGQTKVYNGNRTAQDIVKFLHNNK